MQYAHSAINRTHTELSSLIASLFPSGFFVRCVVILYELTSSMRISEDVDQTSVDRARHVNNDNSRFAGLDRSDRFQIQVWISPVAKWINPRTDKTCLSEEALLLTTSQFLRTKYCGRSKILRTFDVKKNYRILVAFYSSLISRNNSIKLNKRQYLNAMREKHLTHVTDLRTLSLILSLTYAHNRSLYTLTR